VSRARSLLGPIVAATIIVVLAYGASLFQSTPEIFVAASLVFSLGEGIVLALVGAAFARNGAPVGTVVAMIAAVLATPGRWEVAYLRTGLKPQMLDLLVDLGATIAWGAFAGLAGSTVLRERLQRLLPER
jgi:hypothetical protein